MGGGTSMKTRYLILEDGTVFIGNAFGSEAGTIGEVIFNTGMTGYQESIIRSFLLWTNCYINVSTGRELRNKSEMILNQLNCPFRSGCKGACRTPSNLRSTGTLMNF